MVTRWFGNPGMASSNPPWGIFFSRVTFHLSFSRCPKLCALCQVRFGKECNLSWEFRDCQTDADIFVCWYGESNLWRIFWFSQSIILAPSIFVLAENETAYDTWFIGSIVERFRDYSYNEILCMGQWHLSGVRQVPSSIPGDDCCNFF